MLDQEKFKQKNGLWAKSLDVSLGGHFGFAQRRGDDEV
jgi:hypothetical protein